MEIEELVLDLVREAVEAFNGGLSERDIVRASDQAESLYTLGELLADVNEDEVRKNPAKALLKYMVTTIRRIWEEEE